MPLSKTLQVAIIGVIGFLILLIIAWKVFGFTIPPWEILTKDLNRAVGSILNITALLEWQ